MKQMPQPAELTDGDWVLVTSRVGENALKS